LRRSPDTHTIIVRSITNRLQTCVRAKAPDEASYRWLRFTDVDQGLSMVNSGIQYANADGTTSSRCGLWLRTTVDDQGLSMVDSETQYANADGIAA
jgi:hypothetical protein